MKRVWRLLGGRDVQSGSTQFGFSWIVAVLPRNPTHSRAAEYSQLLPTGFAKISQRIDVSIDPIRTHLLHCDVRCEILIDNDPNDSVGGVHNVWRRDEAYPICKRVDPDQPGYVVASILQSIGIQFGGLVQKPAKQRRSPPRSAARR
jgi:hypothetical protein